MANFTTVFLITTTVAALSCLLSTAVGEKPKLAIEVCKNTTDFAFCSAAIKSDPRAAAEDRYMLIDIVFRKAYLNATDARDYIAAEIKSGGCLKKCLGDYKEAIQTLSEMLNDLNSESYYELDVRSLKNTT